MRKSFDIAKEFLSRRNIKVIKNPLNSNRYKTWLLIKEKFKIPADFVNFYDQVVLSTQKRPKKSFNLFCFYQQLMLLSQRELKKLVNFICFDQQILLFKKKVENLASFYHFSFFCH